MALKRILLVGGDPNRPVPVVVGAAIERFGSQRDGGNGELRHACAAIKGGTVDLVIVLTKFCGHGVSGRVTVAARRAGVICWLRSGNCSAVVRDVAVWLEEK